ncbi:hypothetical protein [Actinotalea sp. C106]|uniref:hypothetical protein n=1 Tax=Actinotalea sp. C106 TaxID=2908644 RepID=UPI0020295C02|nr:hypothetical protein [Actinotalea sp. C106]
MAVLQWGQVRGAGRMLSQVYLGPHTRVLPALLGRVLIAMGAVSFGATLALYRPVVRYWVDPRDHRRQVLVALITRSDQAKLVLRLAVVVITTLVLLAGFTNAIAATLTDDLILIALALALATLALVLLVASLLAALALAIPSAVMAWAPHPGRIRRGGPKGPTPDLTAVLAASTVPGGMLTVRAHLVRHYEGQRITVRARDTYAQQLYERLGLTVITSGRGRMTGIVAP